MLEGQGKTIGKILRAREPSLASRGVLDKVSCEEAPPGGSIPFP